MSAAAAVSGMSWSGTPPSEGSGSADDWALTGVFDGQWVAGKRHGQGSIVYASGDTFEGQWVADTRHGAGTVQLAGGGTVSGFWVRDRLHGAAVFRWPFGGYECRVFHHGVQLCARSITEQQARRGLHAIGALTAAAGDAVGAAPAPSPLGGAMQWGGSAEWGAAPSPSPSRLEAQHRAAQLALDEGGEAQEEAPTAGTPPSKGAEPPAKGGERPSRWGEAGAPSNASVAGSAAVRRGSPLGAGRGGAGGRSPTHRRRHSPLSKSGEQREEGGPDEAGGSQEETGARGGAGSGRGEAPFGSGLLQAVPTAAGPSHADAVARGLSAVSMATPEDPGEGERGQADNSQLAVATRPGSSARAAVRGAVLGAPVDPSMVPVALGTRDGLWMPAGGSPPLGAAHGAGASSGGWVLQLPPSAGGGEAVLSRRSRGSMGAPTTIGRSVSGTSLGAAGRNADVLRLLSVTSVNEIGGGRVTGHVKTAKVTDTVESVLKTMSDHSILSMPVYDDEAGRFVGVVHLLDVFSYMLDIFSKKKSSLQGVGHLREALAHQQRFFRQPIRDVFRRRRGGSVDGGSSSATAGTGAVPSGLPSGFLSPMLTGEGASSTPAAAGGEDGKEGREGSISRAESSASEGGWSVGTQPPASQDSRGAGGTGPAASVFSESLQAGSSGHLTGGPSQSVAASTSGSPLRRVHGSTIGAPAPVLTGTGAGGGDEGGADASGPQPAAHSGGSLGSPAASEGGSEHGSDADSGAGSSSSSFTPSWAFRPLPSGCPLLYAARVLSEGVHAVPIVDAEGRIVRLVTQADVIRFLATRLDMLGPLGQLSIEELGLGQRLGSGMVVGTFRDRAIDVMRRMRDAGSTAAPIVDEYGAMATNVSLSDAKTIARRANFSALQLPVQSFLKQIDKGADVMNPSIYCRLRDPLQKVVLTLAATRIHQLYFVDDGVRPVGCIRVIDILRCFVADD